MSSSSTQTLSLIKTIRDFELSDKSVFIRVDFNCPLSEPNEKGNRTITDDTRIREALPTIQYAIEKGARVILGSHLGRPNGKVKPEESLLPIAEHLAVLLNKDILLAEDCTGDGIELKVRQMVNGDVMLLENLRFHEEEEANEIEFSRRLARLGHIYINDAFGTAHRKHASTYGMASQFINKGCGLLMEKEILFFDRILKSPQKPFIAVLGGAKVSDKIKTIEELLKQVNGVLVGGAMAHAFALAQGRSLPEEAKAPKKEDIEAAKHILTVAHQRDIPIHLPVDTINSFDIGPKTIENFSEVLATAKTIFWNGPLGWFEKPEYATGTFEIAKTIAALNALKVVGGGDTVAAVKASGVAAQFDHLSTGGGATLELIEHGSLPGIDVLKQTAGKQS